MGHLSWRNYKTYVLKVSTEQVWYNRDENRCCLFQAKLLTESKLEYKLDNVNT